MLSVQLFIRRNTKTIIKLKWLFAALLLVCCSYSSAQVTHDFGFIQQNQVPVRDVNGFVLPFAWVGGLNACQFHTLDINLDGLNDLVIFDRHGNRLLPFINRGLPGLHTYEFRPEFEHLFPAVEHWIQFIDYDGDEKKDIFTYTIGGIRVFRNISTSKLKFQLISNPFLLSQYGTIQTNIMVTPVDYPAISDLDSDGDLDILTFWGLGSFVEIHQNQSVELFGHRDSLRFIKKDYCWGRFAESVESNQIILDTCIDISSVLFNKAHERHTGSTLLSLDATGNGLPDLILGDVDYPQLLLLRNEGSLAEARITSVDTLFPDPLHPVRLFSFPVASLIDSESTGLYDLVVSPFTPSLTRSRHYNSVWLYKNFGSTTNHFFLFETESYMQDRMIDAGANSFPVLQDLNGDGLLDLIVGNFGYLDSCWYNSQLSLQCRYTSQLAVYQNTGSQYSPEFQLIYSDFAGLSALGLQALYPAFADIDDDGKTEMLLGHSGNNLMLFKDVSTGTTGFPQFELIDDHYMGITTSGYSTPQFADLNNDGLVDLVAGQKNGRISYYENRGTPTRPVFVKVTDYLGQVDVTDFNTSYTGHSVPCFFRSVNGDWRLFAGSESGRILYYKNISGNLQGMFTLAELRVLGIDEGIRTAPAVAYLTSNNYPDMILGNYGGGLTYYKGSPPPIFGYRGVIAEDSDVNVFPNPIRRGHPFYVACGNGLTGTLLIEITDVAGRLMFTTSVRTPDHVVELNPELPVGLYFVKIYPEQYENPLRYAVRKIAVLN